MTDDLEEYLGEFDRFFGRREQGVLLRCFARGQLGPIERKSLEPIAAAKGSCARHVNQEVNKVKKICQDCGLKMWTDISAARVQTFLADLRADSVDSEGETIRGKSARTSNSYLVAFKGFCAWMLKNRRASENPVLHLSKINERVDRRHDRRALTAKELGELLKAARNGPPVRKMPGPDREMLYRVAMETGLRWGELRSLTRLSFQLDGDPPTVTVAAAYSKHRREDVIPIRQELVETLRPHLSGMLPAASVFPTMPPGQVGAELLRADLTAAGIEYQDASGRFADFHALPPLVYHGARARWGTPTRTASAGAAFIGQPDGALQPFKLAD